jgi:Ras-related protein Rab-1A
MIIIIQAHAMLYCNQEFADSLGLSFIETSAKSSSNVEKAFIHMTSQIKERYIIQSTLKNNTTTTNITSSSIYLNGQTITSQQNMKGCCF